MTDATENILTVSDLQVTFGGVKALDLEHFALQNNELRVVIGPNGAGKSTFMDIICGKTKADTGTILFQGEDITNKTEVDIAQLGIGRKFQKPTIFGSLTIYDNLLLAHKCPKNVWHSLRFKINAEIEDRIHYVAKKIGLETFLNTTAEGLSHGQKQWLEIGIVIMQDAKLMLIDEPAAGMSDQEATKTSDLILSLVQEHSLIVIEHDMHFVERIAIGKVTVLNQGEILTEGSFDEVKKDKNVIGSYLGNS